MAHPRGVLVGLMASMLVSGCTPSPPGRMDTSDAASSSSSAGMGSSSSRRASTSAPHTSPCLGPGLVARHCACTARVDCPSGQLCVEGQCTNGCPAAGSVQGCVTGEQCIALRATGETVCMPVVGVNQACANAACDQGLACNVGSRDGDGREIAEALSCQQACDPRGAANQCTAPRACLPSGPMELQRSLDGGPVVCGLDGSVASCDVGNGFTCQTSPEGARCGRAPAACGTPVPLHPDVKQLMESLVDPSLVAEFLASPHAANVGPNATTDEGMLLLGGGRLCDEHSALARPPRVEFQGILLGGLVGPCVGFCRDPAIPPGVPGLTGAVGLAGSDQECPVGYQCGTAAQTVFRTAVGGAQHVACNTAQDCAAYAGSTCWSETMQGLPTRFCAYPRPVCVAVDVDAGNAGSGSGG